jgi:thiamine-phosphate pyrophosphorylase
VKAVYVTDRRAAGDARLRETLAALSGAPFLSVQLRETDGADRDRLAWARLAREALSAAVPLYVNGRFDIALAAGADGVHLPASGLPLARVRAATPRGFRIGISAHSAAEARQAIEGGADLTFLGPIFDTPSKRAYGAPLGTRVLGELPPFAEHSCEVYAIGGISEENLGQLEPYSDRIAGIAGIRLFQESLDPRGVVERIARR